MIGRRQLLAALGFGVGYHLPAWAQQPARTRRIGVLLPSTADDAQYQAWYGAFVQSLGQAGWSIGRNLEIETRWATSNADAIRRHAAEMVALGPDVLLAPGASTVGPLLQATRTIPIVFTVVADPVGAGFVDSLSRPGGNATGFTPFEYGIAGKWLELLKEIAPTVRRVAVLRDAATPSGVALFGIIQAIAPTLGIDVTPVNMRDAAELESALSAFAATSGGGLIATPSPRAIANRELIIQTATRHRLPAVYFDRLFAGAGGLVSYGPNQFDLFRRAAGYVDRILKGERPTDLPVQHPVTYELVINLKAAKDLGIEASPMLIGRADSVIE